MSEQYAFILKAKTRPEMAEAFETLFRAYVEPSRQNRAASSTTCCATRPT